MRNICAENIIINDLNQVAHANRTTSSSFTSSSGRLHSNEESTAPDRRESDLHYILGSVYTAVANCNSASPPPSGL